MTLNPQSLAGNAQLRVLVVDDRKDVRGLLRSWLESKADFCIVGEAANGAEGVRLGGMLQPDVVIMDLEMPVMRGDQAIPLLRATIPGVRILIYSGTLRAVADGLTGHAAPDAYVHKGGRLGELGDHLRAWWQQSVADDAMRPAASGGRFGRAGASPDA